MSMLSIRKLSANWRRLQQRFGMMIGIALIRKFFYPDLARSAEKVSGSVKEGHGMVSEHREDMPKHPEFANSAFGNPSGA